MSWLKTIYESIVNEIGAEDAYNKFYNKIPREDYDRILDGDPAPDKFMQFILNGVRDGKSDVEDAVNAVKAYKSADQLVRQNVLNKFRAGEYEDAADIVADIEYFSNGGGIVSRKKFAKEGFIKLKENDRWVATCTTNYMANNHYFGKSHWCTASDRQGHYDGYLMFLDYTIDASDGVLIQFSWKGKIRKERDDEPESLDDAPQEAFSKEGLGYIGDEIEEKYSAFQVQLESTYRYRDSDLKGVSIGQICDFYDNGMSTHRLKEYIGDDMFEVLSEDDTHQWLHEKTEEQAKKEKEYQNKMDEVLRKKRERRVAELNRIREELQAQCTEINRRQMEVVQRNWDEFVASEGYKNKEFVSAIIDRDIESRYYDEEDVEQFAATKFISATEIYISSNEVYALQLDAVMGIEAYVDTDEDENGYDVYTIKNMISRTRVAGSFMVFVSEENKEILHTLDFSKPNLQVRIDYALDKSDWNSYNRRYFVIEAKNEDDGEDKYSIVYDAELNKSFGMRTEYVAFYTLSNDKVVFLNTDETNKYVMYNTKTGEIHPRQKGEPLIHIIRGGHGGITFYTNDGDSQTLYVRSRGVWGIEVPTMQSIYDVYLYDNNDRPGSLMWIEFDSQYAYKPDLYNIYRIGEDELLFGVNGVKAKIDDEKMCRLWVNNHGNDMFVLEYVSGKYYKSKGDTRGEKYSEEHEPCDKYGNTEKDKIAKKNFDDWQKAGGHSPEARAQMDKMWADRNDDAFNGEKAMKAWNDDDLYLDNPEGRGYKYDKSVPFQTALQKFDDDDRWRGYVDLKDPIGYGKEMGDALNGVLANGNFADFINGNVPDSIRRNPWYRVGKDGKPIDQPWYDEDEVPANLSDRVVREQKINEEINKLKSIWDRMGLND